MVATPSTLLETKALNEWKLFSLIVIPICLAILIKMTTVDLSTGMGVSSMIQFSVRTSVPWLYLAFAASALAIVLYYYDDLQFIDYVFYWAGLAAWGVRVVAWSKKSWMLAAPEEAR